MADDMEEIDIASLLFEMGSDRLIADNLFLTAGACEEIDVAALIEEQSQSKVFFTPLFLSAGQNEEIDVAALIEEFDGFQRVLLNPVVDSGDLEIILFTSPPGESGDTLQLIDFYGYTEPIPPPPDSAEGLGSGPSGMLPPSRQTARGTVPALSLFRQSVGSRSMPSGRATGGRATGTGKPGTFGTSGQANVAQDASNAGKIVVNIYNSNEAWVVRLLSKL
jgi:hypothetical protein